MNNSEFMWLVGLLEGEGSFMKGAPSKPNQPIISISMTDEDVIAKVASMWDVKYCSYKARKSNWKPSFGCRIRGFRAVELMKKLRNHMSERRKRQIDAVFDNYIPRRQGYTRKLTDTQAKLVLEGSNINLSEVARRFGVNRSVIRKIRSGLTYKHIVR